MVLFTHGETNDSWRSCSHVQDPFTREMGEVIRRFCCRQNFVVCRCHRAIYMYKIMKKCVKNQFKEIFLNL